MPKFVLQCLLYNLVAVIVVILFYIDGETQAPFNPLETEISQKLHPLKE